MKILLGYGTICQMGLELQKILAHPDAKQSPIRELLSQRVDISFGGGYPDRDLFPRDRIAELRSVAQINPSRLQYGPTEPLPEFVDGVGQYLRREIGIAVKPEEISVGTGSQSILAVLATALIRPGQKVVMDDPTYLGALGAFRLMEPQIITIPTTPSGPDLNVLKYVLENNDVQFYYTVPNFANPTGITHSQETREGMAQLAQETGTLIIEDDPYGLLRYRGRALTSLRELAPENTVYVGTASKIIAPDMRTAWIVAPPEIVNAYTIQAGSINLFTSQTNQLATAGFLADADNFHKHIAQLRVVYGERLNVMLDAFEASFGAISKNISWTSPEGGMFVWVSGLPDNIQAVLAEALAQSVNFVPGTGFYANTPVPGTARFNFSNSKPDAIRDGVGRIAQILKKYY